VKESIIVIMLYMASRPTSILIFQR